MSADAISQPDAGSEPAEARKSSPSRTDLRDDEGLQSPVTFARAIRVRNFEEVGSVFADWRGQVDQISTGRFDGTLRFVGGAIVRVVAAAGTQRLRLIGRDASGMLAIYPIIPGMSASTWKGKQPDLGQIIVGGSQEEIDITSERRYSGSVLFLSPSVLEDASRSLLGVAESKASPHSALCSPTPEAFARLTGQVSRLMECSLADPAILGTLEGRVLEQECIRAVIDAFVSWSAPPIGVSSPGRSKLARKGEDFLRANLDRPVGTIDLCREVGVSDRTLRLTFHERFGCGPMTYFRFLRLNAVRDRLRANPELAIADAARAFGFHHLGNFAADYRRLFRIRPSETER